MRKNIYTICETLAFMELSALIPKPSKHSAKMIFKPWFLNIQSLWGFSILSSITRTLLKNRRMRKMIKNQISKKALKSTKYTKCWWWTRVLCPNKVTLFRMKSTYLKKKFSSTTKWLALKQGKYSQIRSIMKSSKWTNLPKTTSFKKNQPKICKIIYKIYLKAIAHVLRKWVQKSQWR